MDTPNHDIAVIKSSDHAVTDPVSGRPGVSSGVNITRSATAHPVILYKGRRGEFFLRGDWFDCKHLEAPSYLVIYCPVCRNSLRIGEDNKRIEFDPHTMPRFSGYDPAQVLAGLRTPTFGGTIQVERFGCTWEIEPSLRRGFGFGVCDWKVEIVDSIARDA